MLQLQTVDIKLLRVFDTVVRYGGFSAAQACLNISQSSVSEQMAQLEVRLGARLCERGRGGFRLTEQGVEVHRAAQTLLAAVDQFRQDADSLSKHVTGKLNFGIIDNTITDRDAPVAKAMRRFMARGHEVHVAVYLGPPAELEARVLDGRLHFAIGHFPFKVPGLSYSALYQEAHGLYCGRSNALYEANIALRDLSAKISSANIVARAYMQQSELKLLGAKRANATVENVEAQALLILSGAYIGFLPSHYALRWVATGELRQLAPKKITLHSPFERISRRSAGLPLIVKTFLEDLEASK